MIHGPHETRAGLKTADTAWRCRDPEGWNGPLELLATCTAFAPKRQSQTVPRGRSLVDHLKLVSGPTMSHQRTAIPDGSGMPPFKTPRSAS